MLQTECRRRRRHKSQTNPTKINVTSLTVRAIEFYSKRNITSL